MIYKFQEVVSKKDGFLRGPFGSALKKSLFVPKGNNTYKVYEQCVPLEQNEELGRYYISKEYFDEAMFRFETKPRDFLVSCSGVNYGAIYQLSDHAEKGVINQALLRIRLNNEIIDDNYFLFLFKCLILKKITSGTGDSTIPNFPSMDVVKNIEFDLPSLSVQKKIGEIFKNIENKIKNNNKIINELELMSKTLYDYWFLQFEFPNEEGKPYKSSGGKMVYNEELKREIPEGWILKHAVDIAEIKTGKEDANHSTENGQYPFFTCSNDTLKCNDYRFDSNSILIAGNGDFNVKHYKGKFNAYQRTYVITPFNEKYIGLFELCCKQTIERFKKGSNGSIVKFITLGDIQNIQMLDSGLDDLLKPFNDFLVKIDVIKKENQELASLRDFLLPMLMNGQVTFNK